MKSAFNGLQAVFFCILLAGGLQTSGRAQGSIPPSIITQPQDLSSVSGGAASLTVEANGTAPLRYQWRLAGTNLPGATNATLQLSNVKFFNGGPYTVAINNSFGAVTSAVAVLTVDPDLVFRIIALETNGPVTVDHNNLTGDDRGGIAVSTSNVFITGDGVSASGFNPVTVRFPLDTLAGGTGLGRGYDALVSNLRTETIYSLGNGANLVQYTNGLNFSDVTSLIELNGQTGQPTGQRINLSTSVNVGDVGSIGIFAGYDRVVIHNGTRLYSIALPSGVVTDVGAMPTFNHASTESWAYWGIAEYTGSGFNLIYVQNSQNIARLRVSDQTTTPVLSISTFPALGDMASITFSISRSRWFFHHESETIFRTGGEVVGSAKASYTTDAGYPAFTLEPQNQVSYPGSNVTFSAAATGATPLFYQWHFNGTPIPGATGSTLTLTNLGTNAAGAYRVDVSNPIGLVASRNAQLIIYSNPQIVSQPASRGVFPGTNASFFVSVNGAPPLTYHWRHNGTPVANPSSSSLLLLTNVQPAAAGMYSVLVSNRFGTAISSNAELFVAVPQDDGAVFQIASLTTNGARTVEAYDVLNNYGYGPFAVSSNRVFYSTFNESARLNADDLLGGAALPRYYPAFVSNLRTEVVYAPGTASGPFTGTEAGTLTSLWEIDGSTGALSSRRVNLSRAIVVPAFGNGTVSFYSGYDRAVVLNGTRAYSIALPSGAVTDLGPMGFLSHASSFSGAYWGIAEHSGGITYLVYGRNSQNIARTRVPDGVTTNLANFPNGIGSYFSSLSASIRRGRWYFHYLFGNSTFGSFNLGIGYANATFNINSGARADHFEWSPLADIQVLNTPFNVTITARSTTNAVDTTYQGSVSLSGANVANGASVPINPTVISNFVNGVWSGQVRVLASSTGMVLRATDGDGLTGLSSAFSVSPSNDLVLRIIESADPILVGGEVTYTLFVTNTGPAPATGVMLTNLLPTNAVFVSHGTTQGSCVLAGNALVCDFGTVPVASSPTVSVVLRSTALGTLTYTASLRRGEVDPSPGNDTVTETTDVRLPAITILDASLTEGNSGTNELQFPVRLSPAATGEVSVAYTTFNGTATSSGAIPDYVPASGVLVFPAGSTNQTITVRTRGDIFFETNETFFISLSFPTNATIARTVATGLISNDDSPPLISVGNATITEGNSGFANAVFQLRLSTNCGLAVSVRYSTFDGTATAPDDYTNVTGLVTFPANTLGLTRNVVVPVRGDTDIEPDEQINLQIYSATNGIIANDIATCTIVNDDGGGVFHHYAWQPVASPQPANTPFPVTLQAQDIFNSPVTSFSGSVQLRAGGGPNTDTNILGNAEFPDNFTADYTLGYAFTPRFDLTVTHLRRYFGSRISLWNSRGTLLAEREVASPSGSWTEIALDQPVVLTANEKYIIASYTGGEIEPYYSRNDGETNYSHVTLIEGRLAPGDAFASGVTPYVGWIVDIRYQVGEGLEPVPISPTTPATFTGGVWNGALTVEAVATNLILTATDAGGAFARSSRFDTATGTDSDLEIRLSGATSPIPVGSNLTFTVSVINRGPLAAIGVLATNELPAGFTFVSVTASQGTASNSAGRVLAQLGSISQGAQASVTILARADATGWHTNRANTTGARPDPILPNNQASLASFVFRDTDQDGMWDDWEQLYGLNLNDPGDAAQDLDNDRQSNFDEFFAGTRPDDATSALRFLDIIPGPDGVRLTFLGVQGRAYGLESQDEVRGPWTLVFIFRVDDASSPPGGAVVELDDPRPAIIGTRVYRIQALSP